MRHKLELDLTIRFLSKWHSGSGEGSLLLDRMIARDARNKPCIPATTLKGVVRESCERLSRTLGFPPASDPHQRSLKVQDNFFPLARLESPVDRLFGNHYESGLLFFRDARLAENEAPVVFFEQSRICKYRNLKTAKDGHLFSTEYAPPLDFRTVVDGFHQDLAVFEEGDPPYAYCILAAAIMNVDRIGGDRSTGAGKVRISLGNFVYNDRTIPVDTIFDYLDPEFYSHTRKSE